MAPDLSKSFFAFSLILCMVSGASAGDLKVVSITRFQNGNAYPTTQFFKGERARTEWRDQSTWKPGRVTYGPPRATVWQCDAQRAIDLNLRAHQYSILELNEQCRSRSALPPPEPKGKMDVYIERVDTGERRQILGQAARHIITHQRQVAATPQACWRNAVADMDGWYIDLKRPETGRRLRQAADESGDVILNNINCRDKIEVHRTGVEKPGFAIKEEKTVRTAYRKPDGTTGEYTTRWEFEVTELSEAPLDTALFDLPTGFTKVDKIDACPDMPFSVAVQYWWHRTVREVRSWFY